MLKKWYNVWKVGRMTTAGPNLTAAMATVQEEPMLVPSRPPPLGDRQPISSKGPRGIRPHKSPASKTNSPRIPSSRGAAGSPAAEHSGTSMPATRRKAVVDSSAKRAYTAVTLRELQLRKGLAMKKTELSPNSDADGDITEKSARVQLLAERLKTIGRLSDGISGDLRQSLTVIRNSIYFLNIHLGESLDDKVRRHLSLLLREVNSINTIASNLASLASKRLPERQPSDVGLIISTALGHVAVPANVIVEPVIPGDARLYCDPEQVACAVANLITNAIQAMPEGGRVRIVCRHAGAELTLAVSDSGVGMSDEVKTRAFEPLFSTSPHRTGLGLTVVRALVGANGGSAEVESKTDTGTTVTLHFPRFD